MTTQFKIDTEAVGNAGKSISENGASFLQNLENFRIEKTGIRAIWDGDDAIAFEGAADDLLVLLNKVAANMEGAGSDLSGTSADVIDTVEENKGAINRAMNDFRA